jgi:hypothetical protein
MARVGRFQVMATLQAARALALGLPLDEAKSWGLNRAIFYAAAKRGFGRSRSGARQAAQERGRPAVEERPRPSVEIGGEEAFLAAAGAAHRRFQIGDEPQTPEEFDREIAGRFPDWQRAWAEAQRIIAAADPADLNSAHAFFDRVYKPRRDTVARTWSAT